MSHWIDSVPTALEWVTEVEDTKLIEPAFDRIAIADQHADQHNAHELTIITEYGTIGLTDIHDFTQGVLNCLAVHGRKSKKLSHPTDDAIAGWLVNTTCYHSPSQTC